MYRIVLFIVSWKGHVYSWVMDPKQKLFTAQILKKKYDVRDTAELLKLSSLSYCKLLLCERLIYVYAHMCVYMLYVAGLVHTLHSNWISLFLNLQKLRNIEVTWCNNSHFFVDSMCQ